MKVTWAQREIEYMNERKIEFEVVNTLQKSQPIQKVHET